MEGDVEEVEVAEGVAGVLDGYGDGGETVDEDYVEGVEEDAFGGLDVFGGFALDALAGGGAG